MEPPPSSEGLLSLNFDGLGTVTKAMVRKRALELAAINGRSSSYVNITDWDQAKRELTGGASLDSKETLLESIPESDRAEVILGSTGHQVHEAASEEVDEDGHSQSARLVEEGLNGAEHDQRLQAAKLPRRDGRR